MVQNVVKIPVKDDEIVLKTKDYKIDATALTPDSTGYFLRLGFAAALGRGETSFAKRLRAAGLDEKKVEGKIRARRRELIKGWTAPASKPQAEAQEEPPKRAAKTG